MFTFGSWIKLKESQVAHQTIDTLENPSSEEFDELIGNVEYHVLRGIVRNYGKGDLIVWPATAAIHYEISPTLSDVGINIRKERGGGGYYVWEWGDNVGKKWWDNRMKIVAPALENNVHLYRLGIRMGRWAY